MRSFDAERRPKRSYRGRPLRIDGALWRLRRDGRGALAAEASEDELHVLYVDVAIGAGRVRLEVVPELVEQYLGVIERRPRGRSC